ncbi:MAG: hypothetical protein ACRELG_26275 [Gemmataceae bacterium]
MKVPDSDATDEASEEVYPPEPMEAIKIGTRVNNARYDEPELVKPIDA